MLVLIVPRLLYTALRYLQPTLINRTIAYVSQPSTEFKGNQQEWKGVQLIVLAFILYAGCSVSNQYIPGTRKHGI